MATEQAKGIKRPKDESIPGPHDAPAVVADGQEQANLEGYRGPDGSKGLGYLKQPPGADRSGLGSDADDAGRSRQEPGQNSGAGAPTNIENDTAKAAAKDKAAHSKE